MYFGVWCEGNESKLYTYWMSEYIYVFYELCYYLSIISFKYSSKTSFGIFKFLLL